MTAAILERGPGSDLEGVKKLTSLKCDHSLLSINQGIEPRKGCNKAQGVSRGITVIREISTVRAMQPVPLLEGWILGLRLGLDYWTL